MRFHLNVARAGLLAALLAAGTPLFFLGAAPAAPVGPPPVRGGAMPAGNNAIANQTAKAFAPFILAIVTRRVNQAGNIFKMSRAVETSLETPEVIHTLTQFNKPNTLSLNLIGGRTLGQNIGILMFTVATEQGPVAFKIYYYGFNNDINISRIEITDDWDEIERLSLTVDNLPAPITVGLGGAEEGAGQ